MMRRGVLRAFRVVGLTAAIGLALWYAHPWVVRPIVERTAALDGASVEPSRFADSIWAPTLVPAVVAAAVDARALVDAWQASPVEARTRFGRADGSGSWYVVARGNGRVLSVDRTSSNGVAALDIAPYDGRPDLTLQIGPVIRGTALRDATGRVAFSLFSNQLQFADVAHALNARAVREVIDPVASALAQGRIVRFVAAGSDDEDHGSRLSALVPVQLAVEGPGRE